MWADENDPEAVTGDDVVDYRLAKSYCHGKAVERLWIDLPVAAIGGLFLTRRMRRWNDANNEIEAAQHREYLRRKAESERASSDDHED